MSNANFVYPLLCDLWLWAAISSCPFSPDFELTNPNNATQVQSRRCLVAEYHFSAKTSKRWQQSATNPVGVRSQEFCTTKKAQESTGLGGGVAEDGTNMSHGHRAERIGGGMWVETQHNAEAGAGIIRAESRERRWFPTETFYSHDACLLTFPHHS